MRERVYSWLCELGLALVFLLRRAGHFAVLYPIRTIFLLLFLFVAIAFYHSLPTPLFDEPTCTVLTDRDGVLLAASIAPDGQYRFAPSDTVPERFVACVKSYEDRYFYWHLGVNPVSVAAALYANVRAGHIVRGGSTLTMQVARMMHRGAPRTLWNKCVETLWALRLELSYSKSDIMALWASYAPFGGNVVGLGAAAWRYYQTEPANLSWGQCAALAVLPNAPAYIYPGANSSAFRDKRDRLLRTLHAEGTIDDLTLELALEEPLPAPAEALPQYALHLLSHAIRDGHQGQTVRTTISIALQREAERVVRSQAEQLGGAMVRNVGAIVAGVETGEVLAYVGNVPDRGQQYEGYVNMVTAERSTGSVLKPLLFAGMLNDGLLLPTELVADVPMKIGDFSPKNANRTFQGTIPAEQALSRSLNVPSVRMLQRYDIGAFLELLRSLGASTFRQGPDYYGLPLILGGGECTLWELAGIYASLARTLRWYTDNGAYYRGAIHPLRYVYAGGAPAERGATIEGAPLSAGSIYLTFQALRNVNRPIEEAGWQLFSSSRAVAWKTGTSWGGRDAWAIGVNRDHVVGVWTGNATGEGQPANSGVQTAAPVMFQLWGLLPHSSWFDIPWDDLAQIPTCRTSGLPPSPYCPDVDTTLTVRREGTHLPCPYHQLVHLDSTESFRVNASCYGITAMHTVSWFVLPPTMAWYYARVNPSYRPLPPWMEGCQADAIRQAMQFIYPRQQGAVISVPRDMDGSPTHIPFEVAHARREACVYWHLDGEYIGYTISTHNLSLQPTQGHHTLTVVDDEGNRCSISFEVLYSSASADAK